MYYKCELLVGGYAYGVTDHIKNWDDMTVSFKRNDYDGVVRTFTDKFEFVKGARQLILNEYRDNYLKASASIVVSTRNNSWTWTERFRCALDFSTLSDDGFTLSINAVDDSVAALIKAKKGTQYEYSVAEVKDEKSLYYDHLQMKNEIKWSDGGTLNEEGTESSINFPSTGTGSVVATIPFYISSEELCVKDAVEVNDASWSGFVYDDDRTPFVSALKDQKVRLKMDFKVYGTESIGGETYGSGCEVWLYLRDKEKESGGETLKKWYVYNKSSKYYPTHIFLDEEIELKKGTSLELLLYGGVTRGGDLVLFENNGLSVSFEAKNKPVELNLVSPSVLLNRLLRSMNGGKDGLTGVIVPSGEKRLDNAMLLAAESARQMPGAKIYSSFTKFCNWMSAVFGYVYDINDKVVTFRPRKDYFENEVVKDIDDYNGYTMNVNSSLIYSQINVGYEKQDYDSVNGKDEFRFMNIYNTGITMTDNKLELISPYRADAYGIEFLVQKIGEDTTDNESDTAIFFACVRLEGERYMLDRSEAIGGVISPETMFNVMYSPTSMVEANKDYLGGFVDELLYASSEGNTDVIINGLSENRDMELGGGLFSVSEVEVETSDIELPERMTGIVRLQHQGETVEGYYKSADFCYTKTKNAKITLIMKKHPLKM